MNIKKFKEITKNWENYQENFKAFRVWAENCYELYMKEYYLAREERTQCFISNIDEVDVEQEEMNLKYQWSYIELEMIVDLYNRMGWKLSENLANKTLTMDSECDVLFYDVVLQDIYSQVINIEDDIEFAYAVLMICVNIRSDSKLYKVYAVNVINGLKENELYDCLKLLDVKDEKKVFVAMWFDKKVGAARRSIEKAVKECGYIPIFIDEKEHSGQIVPEILQEIEESQFVIADLTGNRGGVYYEAGYAMAKDKQVILSCKKGENGKRIHFDVAQINTIFWNDEEDLYMRLVKRIKATAGEV